MSVKNFQETLLGFMDKCFPRIPQKRRAGVRSKANEEIEALSREKKENWLLFISTKNRKYKKQVNKLNKKIKLLLTNLKREYLANKIKKAKPSTRMKTTWKIINDECMKGKERFIEDIEHNGSIICNPQDIVNFFNSFFYQFWKYCSK